MISGACDFSMDSIESVESVISSHSITNYHSKGPTIFNLRRSRRLRLDLGGIMTSQTQPQAHALEVIPYPDDEETDFISLAQVRILEMHVRTIEFVLSEQRHLLGHQHT